MTQQNVLVALGANIPGRSGGRRGVLRQAVSLLNSDDMVLARASAFYATPAVPAGSGPEFVNAAAAFVSGLSPEEVLARLHGVEARLGRVRGERWGPRVIDLDLLAVEACIRPDAATLRTWMDLPIDRQGRRAPDELVLPHPRMQDRAFVLVPLCDVAPDWRHPVLGRTAREMRDALDRGTLAQVRPIGDRGST